MLKYDYISEKVPGIFWKTGNATRSIKLKVLVSSDKVVFCVSHN